MNIIYQVFHDTYTSYYHTNILKTINSYFFMTKYINIIYKILSCPSSTRISLFIVVIIIHRWKNLMCHTAAWCSPTRRVQCNQRLFAFPVPMGWSVIILWSFPGRWYRGCCKHKCAIQSPTCSPFIRALTHSLLHNQLWTCVLHNQLWTCAG